MRDTGDGRGGGDAGQREQPTRGPGWGLGPRNSPVTAAEAQQCFPASAVPGSRTQRRATPTHPLAVLHHAADVLQRLEVLGVHGAELHDLIIHLQALKKDEEWRARLEVKRASGALYPSTPV